MFYECLYLVMIIICCLEIFDYFFPKTSKKIFVKLRQLFPVIFQFLSKKKLLFAQFFVLLILFFAIARYLVIWQFLWRQLGKEFLKLLFIRQHLVPFILVSLCWPLILWRIWQARRSLLIFFLIFPLFLQILLIDKVQNIINSDLYLISTNRTAAHMWQEIHLTGYNFGQKYDQAKVLVAGKEQRIYSWTNEKVIFVVDPNNTPSGDLQVIDHSGRASNSIHFEYIPL